MTRSSRPAGPRGGRSSSRLLLVAGAALAAASCSKSSTKQTPAEPAAARTAPRAAAANKQPTPPSAAITSDKVARVPAAEAHALVKDGKALLVCAYDSDDKFAKMALQGAIPRSKLEDQLPLTPKNKQLIFYCA